MHLISVFGRTCKNFESFSCRPERSFWLLMLEFRSSTLLFSSNSSLKHSASLLGRPPWCWAEIDRMIEEMMRILLAIILGWGLVGVLIDLSGFL